eukprot:4895497-Pyramimonas_sp.AAC.1
MGGISIEGRRACQYDYSGISDTQWGGTSANPPTPNALRGRPPSGVVVVVSVAAVVVAVMVVVVMVVAVVVVEVAMVVAVAVVVVAVVVAVVKCAWWG